MATIEDFIGYAANKDFTKAGDTFNSMMADKMAAALDQEKIKVGGQIYNDMDPEEMQAGDEDQLELDLDDQEEPEEQIEMELDEEEPSEEEPSEQELETGTTPGHASHLNTCSARTESKDGNAGGQAECQS